MGRSILGAPSTRSTKTRVLRSAPVKNLRLWLLVLLAVLLPLRGAVAAGMPCPDESSPPHHRGAAMAHDHHAMGGHAHAQHAADEHAAPAVGHGHDGAGHADKCNLCAACCSGSALPTSATLRFAAGEANAGVFPEPSSLAPSFVPEGRERPPRST